MASPDLWETRRLDAGDLSLAVLPGIGGRLWDVVFQGRSLLFQNPDLAGADVDLRKLEDLPTRSPQFGFPLWGGEKTWIAPDTDWRKGAPYPALDSAPYDVVRESTDQIALRSHICPDSGLQVSRWITLRSADAWTIHHLVRNRGVTPRSIGIWSVMMLRHPTTIEVARGPGRPH